MTNEEAIRKLEHQKLQFLEEYVDYSGISEAYDMAIKALEKQKRAYWINDGHFRGCSNCRLETSKRTVGTAYWRFCPFCGAEIVGEKK